jgi:hypothetical protein
MIEKKEFVYFMTRKSNNRAIFFLKNSIHTLLTLYFFLLVDVAAFAFGGYHLILKGLNESVCKDQRLLWPYQEAQESTYTNKTFSQGNKFVLLKREGAK